MQEVQQGPLLDAEKTRRCRLKRALEEGESLKKENAKLRKANAKGQSACVIIGIHVLV